MSYRNFEDARKFVRDIGIKKIKDWKEYCKSGKKPLDIPRYPEKTYKESGWSGYGDWLGTGNVASFNRKFRSYEAAKKFASNLGLTNFKEWQKYCSSGKKPKDIPARPERTYRERGWENWQSWLGSSAYSYSKYHMDFESARNYARNTGIKKTQDWYDFCKSGRKNPFIPSNPNVVYRDKGWIGMKDWLGVKSNSVFSRNPRST